MRENFSWETTQSLKDRAGNTCSFPNCPATTSGPSLESETQRANTGIAAHICAASQGKGARRRLDLSKFDRNLLSHYSNGIWMCATHAKLIDTDEVRFTVEMLARWRELAELRAMLKQETGQSVKMVLRDGYVVPLAVVERLVNRFDSNVKDDLCHAVMDSCLSDVWGQEIGYAVRDLTGELLENAFKHGKANEFRLNIDLNRVVIKSNDQAFSFAQLLNAKKGRGGKFAAESLVKWNDRLITSYRREGQFNVLEIAFITSSEELLRTNACSVDYGDFLATLGRDAKLPALYSNCETIYIAMGPEKHLFPSLAYDMLEHLKKLADAKKRIVVIGTAISEDVVQLLKSDFPDLQVIQLHMRK